MAVFLSSLFSFIYCLPITSHGACGLQECSGETQLSSASPGSRSLLSEHALLYWKSHPFPFLAAPHLFLVLFSSRTRITIFQTDISFVYNRPTPSPQTRM